MHRVEMWGKAMTILTVRDLRIAYLQGDASPLETVKGVSLDLPAGSSLGIVGESGSGKSTLARALMGYCRNGGIILGGSVQWGERRIVPFDPAQRGRFAQSGMAYVPQNPLSSLTPHMKVGEQVCEAVQVHHQGGARQAKDIALDLLTATGLPAPAALYERYPHQLSGGQRQRVVIAAAMATRPRLLILDEPTTALDKTTEHQVLEMVRQLQQRFGTSLIYVSHDLHVIQKMCDRVMVMRHGEVVEEGDTRQVYAAPRHPYARLLLAAMPSVDTAAPAQVLQRISPHQPVLEVEQLCFAYPQAKRLPWRPRPAPEQLTLERISLSIAKGQTLGVVGESGSGKSTLAGIIAGLQQASSGSVKFHGQALGRLVGARSREDRRRIQVIFQDALSSLNPRHKVIDILLRPLELFFGLRGAAAQERVAQLMQALHLEPALLQRYPRQLSGGQQQRVAIARAFAARPDLVICDEITSALDASIQAQVLHNLRALQASFGTSLLFISHDLGVVQQMAQQVLVLHQGKVQAYGPTQQIFADPPNAYTRLLLQAACIRPLNTRNDNVVQQPLAACA